MTKFSTDFVFSSDDDGFEEMKSYTRLTQPVSLYTNIYGFILCQRSRQETMERFFHRGGLGVDHIFNSTWRVGQQFAVNYDDGKDFGSLTTIEYTPNDYWILNAGYDSFTTDIGLRASASDIEADTMSATITYRESDWRRYSLSYSRLTFSDGNNRDQGLFQYEHGLYTRNNWKMRILLDLYASANSLDAAPYFNPDNDLGISFTHLTEHTVMQIYQKAFVHRLYLSLGRYDQAGFSSGLTGAIRYEHDIAFADTHFLLYGLSLDQNIYDGEAVSGYSLYLKWSLLF